VILLEIVIGLIIGTLMAIMPGMNSLVGAVIAVPFGSTAILTVIVTNLFLGTLKECFTPEVSGDPLLSMVISKDQYLVRSFASEAFLERLIYLKGQAAVIGIVIGLIAGYTPIPFMEPSRLSILPIIVALVVILVINHNQEIKDKPIDIIVYLLITTLWFKTSTLFSLGEPVFTFAICCFVIPSLMGELNQKPYLREKKKLNLDYRITFPWIQLPLYLVFNGAGINYDLFNTNLNNTTRAFSNSLFLKSLFEFAAITKMYIDPTRISGITEVASEVNEANLFIASAVALISALIATNLKAKELFYELAESELYRKIGLGCLIFLVILLAGWVSPLFLFVGYLFNKNFKGLSLQIQGLLFLSPLLF
jgi:hypothetical protein